jgi:hypothetical protein
MAHYTVVIFHNEKKAFHTSKDAYIWRVDKFAAADPAIMANDLSGPAGKYIARVLNDLCKTSPHLADNSVNYALVSGGWYVKVKLSDQLKVQNLEELAARGGFKRGADWTWDVP